VLRDVEVYIIIGIYVVASSHEVGVSVASTCGDAFTHICGEVEEPVDMSILVKLARYVRSALLTSTENNG